MKLSLKNFKFSILIKFIISVIFLTVIYFRLDTNNFISQLEHISLKTLILPIILQVFSTLLASIRWSLLMQKLKIITSSKYFFFYKTLFFCYGNKSGTTYKHRWRCL